MQTALNLVQEDVSLHKVCMVSDSMSTFQCVQNLHPSQQVANSVESEILDALASPTNNRCHPTFTWCPSHSCIRGNEIGDVAAKEGTTVEQDRVSHDSAKTAIQQSTNEPPHLAHRIYDKR